MTISGGLWLTEQSLTRHSTRRAIAESVVTPAQVRCRKAGELPYGKPLEPESVISVMMIIDYVFEQMLCRFDGAMGFHCN